MKQLTKQNYINSILGANLLGTGGGGTIAGAKKILSRIQGNTTLVSLSELKDTDLICTVFGVGGKQACDPIKASKAALQAFQNTFNKRVSGVIAVEVGAMAVANALFIANKLNIPLVDSDIVGLRSSPEIFVETISLRNLDRTPCAISNGKGDTALLLESDNLKRLETFFRNFAISSGGDAFVAGYPLQVKQIKNLVAKNSISFSEFVGSVLQSTNDVVTLAKKTDMIIIGKGKITKTAVNTTKGFASGTYEIVDGNKKWEVIFKNENLVLLKNNATILTCPDSLCLLDLATFTGINNFQANNNTGKTIAILGKKALPVWRTKKGKELFSPKKLGLDYKQKLL